MDRDYRLRDYPYVVVRFVCRDRARVGQYPLPVLAERFRADALMVDVLAAISSTCLRNKERLPGGRCQAHLPDMVDPRPPDLPAAAGKRLRVILGGMEHRLHSRLTRRKHVTRVYGFLCLPMNCNGGRNMGPTVHRAAVLLAVALIYNTTLLTVTSAAAQQKAITGTVIGEMIQKVGFRAMIQRQAIMYNLAGNARNNANGTVSITLQGDSDRIDQTLLFIRTGTKKSSTNNDVNVKPATLNANLSTFTVFEWTSQSRGIATPYDLVFHLRPSNNVISAREAKATWNTIAEDTLKGDDLAKFMKHLGEDE